MLTDPKGTFVVGSVTGVLPYAVTDRAYVAVPCKKDDAVPPVSAVALIVVAKVVPEAGIACGMNFTPTMQLSPPIRIRAPVT